MPLTPRSSRSAPFSPSADGGITMGRSHMMSSTPRSSDMARFNTSRSPESPPLSPSTSAALALSPRSIDGYQSASSGDSGTMSSCSMNSPSSQAHFTRHSWQDLLDDGMYGLEFDFVKGSHFGLELAFVREPLPFGLLVVSDVDLSGTFRCTTSHSPGLFPGDVIREANGASGAVSKLREVFDQIQSCGGKLNLIVQPRPPSFHVKLVRQGHFRKKLGISVAIARKDVVKRIRVRVVREEGLVPTWNETNGCSRVCQGDWITHVNGSNNSTKEMYDMMQANTDGQTLELRIEKPSRDIHMSSADAGKSSRSRSFDSDQPSLLKQTSVFDRAHVIHEIGQASSIEAGGMQFALSTLTTQPVIAGARALPVVAQVVFELGQKIVIDDGTPVRELHEIQGFGVSHEAILLKEAIKFDHPASASIQAVPITRGSDEKNVIKFIERKTTAPGMVEAPQLTFRGEDISEPNGLLPLDLNEVTDAGKDRPSCDGCRQCISEQTADSSCVSKVT